MRACRSILPIFLVLAACGKRKDEARPATPAAAQGDAGARLTLGVEALPATTRVILGISVEKLAGSPLARRLLAEALARDPELRPRIDSLLARCQLDVVRDVSSVTIAMGLPEDVAVLARGRFQPAAMQECVRAETADGTVFMTQAEGGLIAATSRGWLAAITDPAVEKIGTRADTQALLRRVDRDAAVWGVGQVPPEAGQRLVEVAGISQPARYVSFEVEADEGLTLRLHLDLASTQDAATLATFARRQLDLLAVAAQRWGLGQVVNKTEITSGGASVKLVLRLDPAELARVEAALAKQTSQASTDQKEQVR